MTEYPVTFGPDDSLMGIVTRPAGANAAALAFLMLNAGVLPRIGPHRINVKLARSLAAAGQTSMRFDLSGQGDSEGAATGLDYRAQSIEDLRHAMDWLEDRLGTRRFAVIGICSGAINAHAVARADERVIGILAFDGHSFRTRWTTPVRHWKRFLANSWPQNAAAIVRRVRGRPRDPLTPQLAPAAPADAKTMEARKRALAAELQSFADRGMVVLLVYSGSFLDAYSYEAQFRDAFGHEHFADRVRCLYCPDIDHTFVTLGAQEQMIGVTLGWAAEVREACT